ncbi:hypothetical protein FOL46_009815, partial [Perkinsus olseni]
IARLTLVEMRNTTEDGLRDYLATTPSIAFSTRSTGGRKISRMSRETLDEQYSLPMSLGKTDSKTALVERDRRSQGHEGSRFRPLPVRGDGIDLREIYGFEKVCSGAILESAPV